MQGTFHIQSRESREMIINRFCKLIAISALVSVCIYLYLEIYVLVAITGGVGLIFLFFTFLNRKKLFNISRAGIVLVTNLGIIFFSLYLGYDSGIYLYFFAAPMLVYLLFDFNSKKSVIAILLFYLASFFFIFFYRDVSFSIRDSLNPRVINLLYSFNFCSAIVLCFGFITYFANNNRRYIVHLEEQQMQLLNEIALREKSENLLKKSLKDRELLLSEVHHRVKNNLAIVSALINMKTSSLNDESSRQIFEETKNRIYSMSLIHNLLYQDGSFSGIQFSRYIDKFCSHIENTYQSNKTIRIKCDVDNIHIDINRAVPLALILNELVTNSYKHAFHALENGEITIGLKFTGIDKMEFWVSDNGPGIDNIEKYTESMGLEIVRSLVEQVDGEMNYTKINGSTFRILLPAEAVAK